MLRVPNRDTHCRSECPPVGGPNRRPFICAIDVAHSATEHGTHRRANSVALGWTDRDPECGSIAITEPVPDAHPDAVADHHPDSVAYTSHRLQRAARPSVLCRQPRAGR